MKKNRAIVVLLLTAIITVFLCYTAGVGLGPTGTGSAKNINTGLDILRRTGSGRSDAYSGRVTQKDCDNGGQKQYNDCSVFLHCSFPSYIILFR